MNLIAPKLRPMKGAPKNGRYVLLAADSGTNWTPYKFAACRYAPKKSPLNPWLDHCGEVFKKPLGWIPCPEFERIIT